MDRNGQARDGHSDLPPTRLPSASLHLRRRPSLPTRCRHPGRTAFAGWHWVSAGSTALPTGVANTRLARSSASTVRPTRPCWAGVTRRPPPTPRADARSRRRGRRARGTRAQRHRSTERPCCPMEIPVQPPAHAGGPLRRARVHGAAAGYARMYASTARCVCRGPHDHRGTRPFCALDGCEPLFPPPSRPATRSRATRNGRWGARGAQRPRG